MKTLAVIPARQGSRGLPGKNKRDFYGKPLVQWALECGKRTCDRVCVTTDDPDIKRLGEALDVEVIDRPDDLAADDTPMLDVLRHVLAWMEPRRTPDVVVLLQPTQPLRTDVHVQLALSLLASRDVDSVVSVVPIPAHMAPDFAWWITGRLLQSVTCHQVTRRQDCRPAYYRDGTVYAIKSEILTRGMMYGRALPLVLSAAESATIDDESDWARAEQIWRRHHAS